jgi:hypothetical protein
MSNSGDEREGMFIQRAHLPDGIAAVKLGAVLLVQSRLSEGDVDLAKTISSGIDFRVVLTAELRGK